MASRFRIIFAVVLIAAMLAVSGCRGGSNSTTETDENPTPIPAQPVAEKPTYTVKLGSIVDSLNFTGRVSPAVEESYYFKTSGRIKTVMVERGSEVVSGTVLAELENDDLLRQLAQAELDLQSVTVELDAARTNRDYSVARAEIALKINQLQLAKARASSSDIDVKLAQINVQRAEAALKQAQRRYDIRAQSGGAEGSGEALALEQATLDYQAAQASLDRATKAQDTEQYDLSIMEQNVALAQLDVQHLEQSDDVQLQQAVERNKLAVERLKAFVADTQVVSTIDGKITSVSAAAGKSVEAYAVVFVVSDDTKLEIRAEPLSSQMEKMQEGMECSIVLSQYPGQELVGRIALMPYPYGTGGGAPTTTGTTTTAEQVDKATHIEFDPGDLELKSGDLVKVVVTLEQKDNVLWLPPAAIRTFSGRKFVVIDDNGNQRRVDVKTGIETEDRVEIEEGLTEGQVVIGQ
ncbi:MAG: HlyD family efflux transporter periplasmic adaptor subunit [Chloroflexi bacterium]|nr:HlyD family efflux transporter periplasmic adaptor subunit [Chloroflexota bacterium]